MHVQFYESQATTDNSKLYRQFETLTPHIARRNSGANEVLQLPKKKGVTWGPSPCRTRTVSADDAYTTDPASPCVVAEAAAAPSPVPMRALDDTDAENTKVLPFRSTSPKIRTLLSSAPF